MLRLWSAIVLVVPILAHFGAKADFSNRRFTFEDATYEISPIRTDWFDACNVCKVLGGELLSIETIEENMAIVDGIREYPDDSFWISGTAYLTANEGFYWASTGIAMDRNFTNWGPNQPSDEEFVVIDSTSNYLWSATTWTRELYFICEFHPCPQEDHQTDAIASTSGQRNTRFTHGNSTYEISDTKLNWAQARNACKARGMHLVSIETFEEDAAILEAIVLLPEDSFWMSGNDLGHEGNYYWEATGSGIGPFRSWGPGEPQGGGDENCLLLWGPFNHLWGDYECDTIHYYICELELCQ